MNWTWTLAMVVAASSAAAAQDGGKLSWRGKNEDPKTVLAEARAQGRPSLLFFTSAGCKYCKIISDGAFSDPQIVDASSGLVCIFVDCDWGKKNEELSNEFRVTGYPTIAFCDPKGKDIGRMQGREIPEVLREIQEITRKYPAAPAPAGAPAKPTLQEYSPALLPVARKSSHTVLIFFYDESQATETVVRSLSDPLLRDLRSRLLLSQTPYRKDSELCVRLDVIRAPTLLLLDPSREKPETQPLGRIAGSRSPRELLRDLEELLGGGA
ncbi:MAG TPA: thioredoxin family protein, partial [Planctomycetota bacterium]|nr:thioredoxin family protein [Planctomycetota bacterium]